MDYLLVANAQGAVYSSVVLQGAYSHYKSRCTSFKQAHSHTDALLRAAARGTVILGRFGGAALDLGVKY